MTRSTGNNESQGPIDRQIMESDEVITAVAFIIPSGGNTMHGRRGAPVIGKIEPFIIRGNLGDQNEKVSGAYADNNSNLDVVIRQKKGKWIRWAREGRVKSSGSVREVWVEKKRA
ncbi:hypothetical protein QYF36_020464 [Acer negundo]|nr:hypothetical protein QYF36_020464 [Acer negundo]